MQGIHNWKKCRKCDEYFDIDTSQELCPKCRNPKLNKEVKENGEIRNN